MENFTTSLTAAW